MIQGSGCNRERQGSSVTIYGNTLEVVEDFIYFGFLLMADNDVSRMVKVISTWHLLIQLFTRGHLVIWSSRPTLQSSV